MPLSRNVYDDLEPVTLHDNLFFTNLAIYRGLRSKPVAISYNMSSSRTTTNRVTVTRHYLTSSIALFDLTEITWGCIAPLERTAHAATATTVPCLLTLQAYGGGNPGRSPALETVELEFDPLTKGYVQAQLKTFQGYVFEGGNAGLESLFEDQSDHETIVKASRLRTWLSMTDIKGLQTLVLSVQKLDEHENSLAREEAPVLFLESLRFKEYRVTSWEFGLGDVRRDSPSNF